MLWKCFPNSVQGGGRLPSSGASGSLPIHRFKVLAMVPLMTAPEMVDSESNRLPMGVCMLMQKGSRGRMANAMAVADSVSGDGGGVSDIFFTSTAITSQNQRLFLHPWPESIGSQASKPLESFRSLQTTQQLESFPKKESRDLV